MEVIFDSVEWPRNDPRNCIAGTGFVAFKSVGLGSHNCFGFFPGDIEKAIADRIYEMIAAKPILTQSLTLKEELPKVVLSY